MTETVLFESVINIIKKCNINMEELYTYYKQKQEVKIEAKKEDIKIEAKKEDIKDNKKDIKEEKKEKPFVFQPMKKIISWADYEDETEAEREEKKKENNLDSIEGVKAVEDNLSDSDEENKPDSFKNAVVSKITKEESVVIEQINKEHEIDTTRFKVYSKKSVKKDLPVIYTLEEFIDLIRMRKRPSVDFYIDEHAHCKHTYEGTLCENVRYCNKIHVQRCMNGDSCTIKRCPFLHLHDMLTEDAKQNFINTMDKYNAIKSKKRVKTNC